MEERSLPLQVLPSVGSSLSTMNNTVVEAEGLRSKLVEAQGQLVDKQHKITELENALTKLFKQLNGRFVLRIIITANRTS
jgi:hypothetical protein